MLSAGCSSNTGPTAGVLTVSLSSPRGDDGAMLFTVSGGPVDSVESIGYTMYSVRTVADTVKIIVAGVLESGPVARIHISDTRQASRYAARVSQVAARVTYAERDPASYSLALQP